MEHEKESKCDKLVGLHPAEQELWRRLAGPYGPVRLPKVPSLRIDVTQSLLEKTPDQPEVS